MTLRRMLRERSSCCLAALALGLLAAGCQSVDGSNPSQSPQQEQAGNTFLVLDPFAPNWSIEQSDLGGDRYAFALKRKRFTSGGDGEAMQVFRRRVEQLAREQGYARFEVLAFTEGVDSSFPIIAQRVSHGIVQFSR